MNLIPSFLRRWKVRSLSAILTELEEKYRILLRQRDYAEQLIALVDGAGKNRPAALAASKEALIRDIVSSEQPTWAGPELFASQAKFLEAARNVNEKDIHARGSATNESQDFLSRWKECSSNYREMIAVELECISGVFTTPQAGV